MFGIALSVAACLRAGTRVDVAWIVDRHGGNSFDAAESVAMTPGGGQLGSLLSGALDGRLQELAGIQGRSGQVVQLDITPSDSAIAGVPAEPGISCALIPGSELPDDLWELLLSRIPVCLVSTLDGDTITDTSLYTEESISDASDGPRRLFEKGSSAAEISEHALITSLWPTPTVVIVGHGEIAESLGRLATMLGWHPILTGKANEATGLIATLAPLDSIVVVGHDLELTGAALIAGLSGAAGYVGAVGPRHLQETRADWLAYRGHTDLSRLRGPAGLDIGARNPQEVALAIAAEIVATQTSSPST